MRRATLDQVEHLVVETVEPLPLGPGEVRVAVEACGICGSDLHMYKGRHPVLRPPLVMGHEFVGRVVDRAPDVPPEAEGRRVVAIAGRGCGTCAACRSGAFNRCASLKVIGGHIPGGLAEFVTLPWDQFVPVPDAWPAETAALVEVAAVGVHTAERYGSVAGRDALVLGAGPIGLVLIRVLKALGAGRVAAADVNPFRRRMAHASGADMVYDLSHPEAEAMFRSVWPEGVDAVFDCAGRPETVVRGLELSARGGTVVLTAIFEEDARIPMTVLQRGERRLVGVQMYHREDFDRVIALIESGRLDLSGLVTHQFSLEETPAAFRLLATPGAEAVKVLVRPGG
ncbi:MAG: alcohol dehydrogenase catalytic domain-containing protein [Actinomycetia bacterium]|nr:alcohol dehydrogenase catalytic domain-containing protein [Actinomycetes bacterium]